MSLQGKTIRGQGGKYRQILSSGSIPENMKEEEKLEILKLTREGDGNAQEKLILAHLRLVISIVNRYTDRYNCGYLTDELDDAAIFGLVVAVDRIAKGQLEHDNVTGYIVVIVHCHISDCLRRSPTIHVPRGRLQPKRTQLQEAYNDKNAITGAQIDTMDLINSTIKTKREQRIVDLKIEGYTDREVAAIMEISATAVFRIRQVLKHRFERLNYNE